MTRKSIPELLDKSVEWTGIPALHQSAEERRKNFRARRQIILPIIAITVVTLAFGATLAGYKSIGAFAPLAYVLAMVAQYFGPIRVPQSAAPYDEFEQILIWKSRTLGLGVALAIAILGCVTFSLIDAFGKLTDEALEIPGNLAMAAMWLLVTIAISVTTLSASLLLPRPLDDEG